MKSVPIDSKRFDSEGKKIVMSKSVDIIPPPEENKIIDLKLTQGDFFKRTVQRIKAWNKVKITPEIKKVDEIS